jgi:glycerophosphoryl diester phosphodiesterase
MNDRRTTPAADPARPTASATLAACAAVLCLVAAPAHAAYNTLDGSAPIVIGHRGASGYLPEHTLQAYALAIQQGANYIEPDLVMTRDGHLIARHEPMLDSTTDVAAKFGVERRTTKMVDGVSTTAYFASDFTLAEIKTLRAVQPRGNRPQEFNGLFEIPTLAEIVTLAQQQSALTGRSVGIYPEVKHSTFHDRIFGFKTFETTLLGQLHTAYGNTAAAPVFIQSFEVGNLKWMNDRTQIKLVQLVDADDVLPDGTLSLVDPYRQPYDILAAGGTTTFADLVTAAGLAGVKGYADGIGPWKPYLVKTVADGVDRDGDGVITIKDRRVDGSTGVIEAAHAAGLLVHAFTFRNDGGQYGFPDPVEEMTYYMTLGVDGVFTDFPDTGVIAVASVPEPASWAVMALGLLGVGAAATRRRARGSDEASSRL